MIAWGPQRSAESSWIIISKVDNLELRGNYLLRSQGKYLTGDEELDSVILLLLCILLFFFKYEMLHEFACDLCAGTMLIFSVWLQF